MDVDLHLFFAIVEHEGEPREEFRFTPRLLSIQSLLNRNVLLEEDTSVFKLGMDEMAREADTCFGRMQYTETKWCENKATAERSLSPQVRLSSRCRYSSVLGIGTCLSLLYLRAIDPCEFW